MSETDAHICQLTYLMVNHLIHLPWCTAIAGYWISSNNTNCQQQPTTGYEQTSKSLQGQSGPARVEPPHTEYYMCDNSSMLAPCLLFYS